MKQLMLVVILLALCIPAFSQPFVQELYTGARVDTMVIPTAGVWHTYTSTTGYWNRFFVFTSAEDTPFVLSFGDTTLYKCVVPANTGFNDYMPSRTVMIRRHGSGSATFYINQWR